MKNNPTFTIDIEKLADGRLQVSVPEIGETVTIEDTGRRDALNAAYRLISAYLQKQQETAKAS